MLPERPVPPAIWQRFSRWYGGSLGNRILFQLQLFTTCTACILGAVSYGLVEKSLDASLNGRLEAASRLHQQRLAEAINHFVHQLQALPQRLPHRPGEADLATRLKAYQDSLPGLDALALYHANGQVEASTSPASNPGDELVKQAIGAQSPRLAIRQLPGNTYLRFAQPYRDEHGHQMALLGTIHLDPVARKLFPTEGITGIDILDSQGRPVYSNGIITPGSATLDARSVRLDDTPLLIATGLKLQLSYPSKERDEALNTVKLIFIILALGISVVTYQFSRRIAGRLVQPLVQMNQRTQEIAAAGPEKMLTVDIHTPDEAGQLARAFNGMIERLQESYATLEQRVEDRTNELTAAREQLAGVLGAMEDGVYSLATDRRRIHYLSPGMARIFGRPVEDFFREPDLWLTMIHQDDRLLFAGAERDLHNDGKSTCRYRIQPPQGGVRWIQENARLVHQNGSQERCIAGIISDVTRQVQAEQARSQAEKSLRLLERALAASANGVVITDMSQSEQPIIYANAAFQRITGYELEEVLGRNCRFLQGEHTDQEGLQILREAIRRGEESTVTLRNFRKDGQCFWNRLSISPILDDNGKITHYVGVQQDITEVVESTKALTDSERRLTLTFDAINEGVWDYFIQRDRVYVASSWPRILGYDMEELPKTAEALWIYVHPDDLPRAKRAMEIHLRGDSAAYHVEHRMRCKDGHEIWVESRGRIVERDDDGQPLRMVGTITDITEHYGFEQQIMEWNARMDSIFTLSPDGFVYFDQNRRVEYANPAFEAMTGMPIGKILNMDHGAFATALAASADPAQPALGFLTDMDLSSLLVEGENKRPRKGFIHLIKPEHKVLAYDLRRTPNCDSLVLYLRDITRETEVDRMKSEFLSTAAHELRTPMASIMGFSELLLKRDYKPEIAKDLLDTIHRQSKRLTNLLNELLDLARIEARAGKDFKLKRQNLAPIVEDTLAVLAAQEGHNLPVLNLPDDLPLVCVDESKLQQAVMNVLSNAYKYSPKGGQVTVDVITSGIGGGQRIGIRVQDQGIGMTEEQLGRLFERFYRADPSGNIPGTGLGMSLVKEIMEHHGGSIDAASDFGKGSTITLWLPTATELPSAELSGEIQA